VYKNYGNYIGEIQVFIIISEQHSCADLAFWFLFNASTRFGCQFQPFSGKDIGSHKEWKVRSLSSQTVDIKLL